MRSILLLIIIAFLSFCACDTDRVGDEAAKYDDEAPSSDFHTSGDDDDDNNDDDDNDNDNLTHILPRSSSPGHLIVLDVSDTERSERYLAAGLQGLVNRKTPEVYIIGYWSALPMVRFLDHYIENHGVTYEEIEDVWSLIERYPDYYKGAVVFDADIPETVDVATTIAGLEDLLILHPDLVDQAMSMDLDIKYDLRGKWADKYQAFDWAVANLLPSCTKEVVADLEWDDVHLRDYLVQHKVFTFRYKAITGEYNRLKQILEFYPANTPVLGYLASSGLEESFAEVALSSSNTFLIPSDNAPNFSIHSGIEVDPERIFQKEKESPDLNSTEVGKCIFVSFALSDGDNYSIPMNKMLEGWDDPKRGQIPLSWTIPLTIPTLAPGIAEFYYDTATANDRFTTISGVGYFYPLFYRDQQTLIQLTAMYAGYLGIDDLWLLDPALMIHLPGLLDNFLVKMADEGSMKGFAANYFRFLKKSDFTSSNVPLVYTMISYPDDPVEKIRFEIELAKSMKKPDTPIYLFFGLNIWEMLPSHVVEALEIYEDDDTIRPVFLSEMFDLMTLYPPGQSIGNRSAK